MENLGKVAFDCGAFFIILFCLINSIHFKRAYALQKRIFRLMLLNSMVSAVFSVLDVVLVARASDVYGMFYFVYLLKLGYFLTQLLMAPIFFVYIMCVTGLVQAWGPRQYTFTMLPMVAVAAMILTNPLTGWMFTYTTNYVYERGGGVNILYLVIIFYITFGLIVMAKYRQAMTTEKLFAVVFTTLLGVTGAVIELYFPELRVELFGEALCYFSLLLNIEIDQYEFDPVTELFNRNALMSLVNRKLLTGQKFAIIHVHFNNIKSCASVLANEERDRLIYQVGQFLQGINAEAQCFACGNDEFSLVLPNESATVQARVVGEIKRKFSEDFHFEGKDFTLHVTAGILKTPEQFTTLSELSDLLDIDFPDDGLRIAILADDKLAFIKREAEVAKALQSALAEKRLEIYYQPIWAPHTHQLYAAEALSRLTDEKLGRINPDEFIPVAEKNGMIVVLGEYVMESCCKLLHDHAAALSSIEYIEINLSVHQLLMNDLPDRFKEIMDRYGVTSRQINLEITESAAGAESAIFDKTLNRLRDMGFGFSLDDFGTGYSNMARLFNMEFTNVKIDKSLLWNVNKNRVSKEFLESMVSTIHTMGSHVIQEGVETDEQLSYMKDLDCDLIQGYFYSKPLPADEFIEYVQSAAVQTAG